MRLRVFLPLALLAAGAAAQGAVDPQQMPGELKKVRFDQRLGAELPLDAAFVDEDGRSVVLGDYFGARPVVLTFVYYDCPMLCTLALNGLASSLGVVDLDVGREIEVVAVSFDPGEGPAEARAAKAAALARFGRPESASGWHFLTGGEDQIARLTEAAGFAYTYLPEDDEYAHTSGIVIATPQGEISKYFFGIEYPPKDVRLALVEASSSRIGTVVDQVLLYCFRFDPEQGKYTAATLRIVRLFGALTVLALALYLGTTWYRERRRRAQGPTFGAASR